MFAQEFQLHLRIKEHSACQSFSLVIRFFFFNFSLHFIQDVGWKVFSFFREVGKFPFFVGAIVIEEPFETSSCDDDDSTLSVNFIYFHYQIKRTQGMGIL